MTSTPRILPPETGSYLAEHVYYVDGFSGRVVRAWESSVRNFGPNLGNDYGGRLTGAWLERQARSALAPEGDRRSKLLDGAA
jgi:hypothetical protein